jgi:hypothetical protein
VTHHFTPETENVEFNEATTNCMAAIKSLNILIGNKSWRKYQRCRILLQLSHQTETANFDFSTISYNFDFINLTVKLNY